MRHETVNVQTHPRFIFKTYPHKSTYASARSSSSVTTSTIVGSLSYNFLLECEHCGGCFSTCQRLSSKASVKDSTRINWLLLGNRFSNRNCLIVILIKLFILFSFSFLGYQVRICLFLLKKILMVCLVCCAKILFENSNG